MYDYKIKSVIPCHVPMLAVYGETKSGKVHLIRKVEFLGLYDDGEIRPLDYDMDGAFDCPDRERNFIGYFDATPQGIGWLLEKFGIKQE